MATKSLSVRITELEDAIHELAVNRVESYSTPTGQSFTYHDLPMLRDLLKSYRAEASATAGSAARNRVVFRGNR